MANSGRRRGWLIFLALALLLAGLAPAAPAALSDPNALVPFLKIGLPGWQMAEGFPRLERKTGQGQAHVEAQAVLTSGQSTLLGFIMEGAVIPGEIAKIRKMPLADNVKGYCRKTSVQGFEGREVYAKAGKVGFLFVFVTDRCLITLQAKNVENAKVLEDLVNKIDVPKLAALVK